MSLHCRTAVALFGAAFLSVVSLPASAQTVGSIPPPGKPLTTAESRTLCAKADVALLVMLEERGSKVASDKVDAAFKSVDLARASCAKGEAVQGVKHYETAAESLTGE